MESKIIISKEKPKDYHCNCKYCKNLFRGELLREDGKYFSGRERIGYSSFEKKNKHICKGHSVGYRFAIERYSKEKDLIVDPCAGSGTALIEAAKLNRRGEGIELEFYKIAKENSKLYPGMIIVHKGDARKMIDKIKNRINLVITGPPYNNHSDPPERKNLKTREDFSFDYVDKDNLAFNPDEVYYEEMIKLYSKCSDRLAEDGYFIMIIKDPVRNKKPYLLHQLLTKKIEKETNLKTCDIWIHRHYPPTMFMNTYPKRFPDVKIPKYQTIVVMKKINNK